jgi:hypothetical protein
LPFGIFYGHFVYFSRYTKKNVATLAPSPLLVERLPEMVVKKGVDDDFDGATILALAPTNRNQQHQHQ